MNNVRRAGLRRGAAALVLGLAAATAGAVVPGTATSAPTDDCPEAFPAEELAAGQAVDGLTVTSGSEPTGFSGTIKGVIVDGIAPGVDMVMADLTSPEIDRVGGIWQGMSGSPVYAGDGRLVGAVAYGLSWGPSPVAGITPAAAMYDLLEGGGPAPAEQVDVPPEQRPALRESGASKRQVDSGYRQLPMPVGVSGLSPRRLGQATKAFGFEGLDVYATGAAPTSSAAPVVAMAPGGNLAAAMSYGDVSALGVGSTTAVCGVQVLGFGHPANFVGPTTMTMHNADAVYIQEDPVAAPFKVANPGPPQGTVTEDRLAAVLGVVGPLPEATTVSSLTQLAGTTKSRTGETRISVPSMVADLAATHLLANQDRVYDGVRRGSTSATWTFTGTRPNGAPWSLTRTDHLSNASDISFIAPMHLYFQLSGIQDALDGRGRGRIESVDINSTMHERRRTWNVAKAEVRRPGGWVTFERGTRVRARAGSTLRLRVSLRSVDNYLGRKVVRMRVAVPKRAAGASGVLRVLPSTALWDQPEVEGTGFDKVLARVAAMPRESDLVAVLNTNAGRRGLSTRTDRTLDAAVRGRARVTVRVVR
ncbi:MAG: SpoIVB peptidase S55 domain-containing protein [Nocardioides sp.]|nr:SpoIVB peptidase S55 domain-containing protein [Nocardioides sp.]